MSGGGEPVLRPEYDPAECRSCRICKACAITDGTTPHSLCRPVACERTGRWHACACPESHPKESTR